MIILTSNAPQTINLILIGKGHVGNSVLELLNDKENYFKSKLGLNFKIIAIFEFDGGLIKEEGINLKEVLGNGKDFRNLNYWNKGILAKDIIKELNADVVIEATPTNVKSGEPALTHIIESLKSNKDVIASNKAPFYLKHKEQKQQVPGHTLRYIFH